MSVARWHKPSFGPCVIVGWALAIIVGMTGMVRYQMTPAATAHAHAAPAQWPTTVDFPRDSQRLTLVMTLHPQCPCSRASVRELGRLMAKGHDRLTAMVLFVEPKGAPLGWTNTALWDEAAAIPGVHLAIDKNGADAAALRTTTSGHVEVFNDQGKLLFSGGITDGRGHEGENSGVDVILALIHDQEPATRQTPVYGCPLQSCTFQGH